MFQPIPKKARTEVNTSDTSEIHPHSQGVQENNPDLGILPSTSAPHSHSIATNIHVFDLDKAFQTPGRDTVKLTFPDTEKVLHVPIDFFNTCFNQIFRQVTPGDKPIPIKHQYEPFLDMLNFLHPLKRKPLNTLDGRSKSFTVRKVQNIKTVQYKNGAFLHSLHIFLTFHTSVTAVLTSQRTLLLSAGNLCKQVYL